MRILCCGGSLDGTWQEVTDGVREFRRLKPHNFNWALTSKVKVETEIEYEEYRVVDVNLLGFGFKVAMLWGLADEGRAVLKALVQRDVFEHITNPKGVRRG